MDGAREEHCSHLDIGVAPSYGFWSKKKTSDFGKNLDVIQ